MPLLSPQISFQNPQQVAEFILCHYYSIGGEYNRAIPLCGKVLTNTPNGITFNDLLEDAFSTRNLKLLKELEVFLNSPKGKVLKNSEILSKEVKALIAYLNGDVEKFKNLAVEIFRSGLAPQIILQLAAKEVNFPQDWELSAWLLFYIHEKNPNDEKITQMLKGILFSAPVLGKEEEAEHLLQRFIEIDPRPEYYRWLGGYLLASKKYDKALKVLEEGYKRYPSDRKLGSLLSYAYFVKGDILKSFYIFRSEKSPQSDFEENVELFALLYTPRGRELLAEKIADLFTDNPSSLEKMLYITHLTGWDNAILTFGRALEKALTYPQEEDIPYLTLYWLTELRKEKKLKPDEEKLINNLLEEYGDNPLLLLVKSYYETLKGNYKKALSFLKRVDDNRLAPVFLPGYFALKFYYQYNWNDKVLKSLTLRNIFKLLNYLYPLSPQQADLLAEKYLELNPQSNSYGVVIDTFFRLGGLSLAAKYSRRAIQKFPQNPDFLNVYAYTLLLLKGKDAAPQAIELLKKALKLSPKNGAYLDSLGWAYYLMGNFAIAEKYLKEALKIAPKDAVLNYHVGALLLGEGKPCEAVNYLKTSLKRLYTLTNEPEPGIINRVKKLLREAQKNCKTP